MGVYQIKNFCTVKEIINQMKSESTKWDNIFANHLSEKGLISKTQAAQ